MSYAAGAGSSDGGGAAAAPTLRDRQVQSLLSMLNFNQPPTHLTGSNGHVGSSSTANGSSRSALPGMSSDPSTSAPLPTWKVLVLDQRAQDVLATTLRVQDLRDAGVTLHMWVHFSAHTPTIQRGAMLLPLSLASSGLVASTERSCPHVTPQAATYRPPSTAGRACNLLCLSD